MLNFTFANLSPKQPLFNFSIDSLKKILFKNFLKSLISVSQTEGHQAFSGGRNETIFFNLYRQKRKRKDFAGHMQISKE